MRITLIIDPKGEENPIWANLLDCERVLQKHGEFIYDNYEILPSIMIFVPQNIFDYAEEEDYFKIFELCRYKKMDQIFRISKDWNLYALKPSVIKENREHYLSVSRESLRDKFRKLDTL